MRVDDEHKLIARYAARLAAVQKDVTDSASEAKTLDVNRAQRELVAQLEAKNREIVQEIHRLRQEQEKQAKLLPSGKNHTNPTLLAELRLLRQRRDELEARMSALQESRRELMVQLEGLMKLLKQSSPQSTPISSPRIRSNHSPPHLSLQRNNSMPSAGSSTIHSDSLSGVGGDVREAFVSDCGADVRSSNNSVHTLRNDLLVAADSVTNAMSSLVKQMNIDDVSYEDGIPREEVNRHQHYPQQPQQSWPLHMRQQQFTHELRTAQQHGGSDTDNDVYMMTDYESYGRTDGDDSESYVKTDDDDVDYQNVSHLRRI